MKKILLPLLFAFSFCLSISAQKISKPTLTPAEPTPAQKQLIMEGARLHDQKNYAAAIKKYEQVLLENPDCATAIYEITLSSYYLKDFEQTLKYAFEGLKYKSAEIPMFYGLIANVYDDQGQPEKAVALYKEGIKMLEGDASYKPYLSSLYYNLAVTNVRQKSVKEARENLKKAVPLNFKYASPHYLLSQVYYGGNYKVPALLAASRLISLEINSERAQRSALIIQNVLQGGVSKGNNPNDININVDANAPKDEGDFDALNLMLGISKVGTGINAANENQSDEESFASQLESIIGFLEKENKIQSTFVGKNYIPYMVEMKRQGHVKPFAYIVMYHTGNKNAQKWLTDNNEKAQAFLSWAKAY
jgi:tetratricopeptide (TPR) repeat protein